MMHGAKSQGSVHPVSLSTDVDARSDWDTYLNTLQVCFDERAQLLVLAATHDETRTFTALTAIESLPTHSPTANQRAQALHMQTRLAHQESEIEAALATLAAEIDRVEKLQAAQLLRSVTESNIGGFEARA